MKQRLKRMFLPEVSSKLVDDQFAFGTKTSLGNHSQTLTEQARIEIVEKNTGKLIVAVIADGQERHVVAQIAVDAVISSLQRSQFTLIPDMIDEAIQSANLALIKNSQRQKESSLSTLTVAVIFNNRLYVGNVGTNRVYWIQSSGRIIQVTNDHTFGNLAKSASSESQAEKAAHFIGRSNKVGVDFGFYPEGSTTDAKKAYRLGLAGIPLMDGDSIVLCSDGMAALDLAGRKYISDAEIVDAVQTEFGTSAAVKMVGYAEGRKVSENISAIVIQKLTNERIKQMGLQVDNARRRLLYLRIGISSAIVLLIVGIIATIFALGDTNNLIRFAQQVSGEEIRITVTTRHTATRTAVVIPELMTVDSVSGVERTSFTDIQGIGGIVLPGQNISDGMILRSADGYVHLVTKLKAEGVSHIYMMPFSDVRFHIGNNLDFDLLSGGILLHPAEHEGIVRLPNFGNAIARVIGSKMLVLIEGETQIAIMCFEGECGFQSPNSPDVWQSIPVGEKRLYDSRYGELYPSQSMTYEDLYRANANCLDCIVEMVPTITPVPIKEFVSTVTSEPEEEEEIPKPQKVPTLAPTENPAPTHQCKGPFCPPKK